MMTNDDDDDDDDDGLVVVPDRGALISTTELAPEEAKGFAVSIFLLSMVFEEKWRNLRKDLERKVGFPLFF